MIRSILKKIFKEQKKKYAIVDIDYEYYKAKKFYELGDIKSCLLKLQEILIDSPNHLDSLGLYSYILINNYKFKPSYTLAQELSYKNPETSAAWMTLAVAAKEKGFLDEALAATKKAIKYDGNASLHAYAAVLCFEMGRHNDAFIYFDSAHSLQPDDFIYSSSKLFAMSCANNVEYEELMRAHRKWGESVESMMPCFQHARNKPKQKTRIGFVSSDFKNHPVAPLIIPFLENVNKNKFETVCFHCYKGVSDTYTERIRSLATKWYECASLEDFELARTIYNKKIDILFDLSGHTSGHKLVAFAMKPAPIQISWFGYMNTTGLKRMDYRITDVYTIPREYEKFYSEKLLRLDVVDTWLPNPDYPDLIEVPAVKNGFVTFGSFNRWWKITDTMLESWASILKQVSHSKMKMIINGAEEEEFQQMIFQRFEHYGIERDRITLSPNLSSSQFYAYVSSVDIALDTFPYNGGTTSLNTIWMGVPFITIKGKSEVSRSGYALCAHLDLMDFCVETHSDYIDAAVKLAADTERLRSLRKNLRKKLETSKLMNHDLFARKLEQELERLVDEKNR